MLSHLVLGAILDHPFSRTTPLIEPLPSVPTVVPLKGFHCIYLREHDTMAGYLYRQKCR